MGFVWTAVQYAVGLRLTVEQEAARKLAADAQAVALAKAAPLAPAAAAAAATTPGKVSTPVRRGE